MIQVTGRGRNAFVNIFVVTFMDIKPIENSVHLKRRKKIQQLKNLYTIFFSIGKISGVTFGIQHSARECASVLVFCVRIKSDQYEKLLIQSHRLMFVWRAFDEYPCVYLCAYMRSGVCVQHRVRVCMCVCVEIRK